MLKYMAIALMAMTLAGCGTQAVPLRLPTASTTAEARFLETYTAKVSSKLNFAQQNKHLTLTMTSTSFLGKTFSDWNFKVHVNGKHKFTSLMYLGKDQGIYVMDWAHDPAKIRWYKIGEVEAPEAVEDQEVPYHFNPDTRLAMQYKDRDFKNFDEIHLEVGKLPRALTNPDLRILPL